MDIKIYWYVLYDRNKITKSNKISQNTRNAPRHNFLNTYLNIFHKGHSSVFLLKNKGSITAEASFCVPIFFLALFSLFYILQCIYRVNYIEDRLAGCAREYAVFGTKTGAVTTYMDEKVIVRYNEDQHLPVCYVSYNMRVPFLASDFFTLDLYQQVVINNYSGVSMGSNNGEVSEDFVYIAKSGKVYHCDKGCTYLKLSVQGVQGKSIQSRRNSSGGKYKSCEKCCRGIEAEDISNVYITTYGDRYHIVKSCPGLKRDIRRVKKSEIGDFPACSKCGTKYLLD